MKPNFVSKRKKLGEILVSQNRITPGQLQEILRLQKESGKPIGQLMVEREMLTGEELNYALGEQMGIPHVWLRKGLVDPRIVHVLPKEKAINLQVIPMFRVGKMLTLATTDPHAVFVFDEVSKITQLEVQPVLCRADDIMDAINDYYRTEVDIDEVIGSIDEANVELVEAPTEKEISELEELAEGSPVISLTNMILLKAIRDGASDIHIEPQPGKLKIRVRIDGVLYELMSPRLDTHPAIISRLKVMANLDIAERRIPQDGRIQVKVDGRTVDMRFSSMPGINGEKVVLRILDKIQSIMDINTLGFDPAMLESFKSLLRRPYGLILSCGPTGSGKTTTLYCAVSMLNSPDKNIVTIEDPVEYQISDINQNQVKSAIGLNFAKFLKHALRQDPDIIMVGEIRDRETAEIAIQASLTGHMVLSTLHTNDSPSAITRLLEMGVEPYLISSSLMACLSQRLVRTICPQCATDFYAPQEMLKELGVEGEKNLRLTRGKGCTECYDSGFKGRIGIYELLEIDEDLQGLILKNPSIDMIKGQLREKEFRTLKEVGYSKVLEGATTIDEVQRVSSIEGY